MSRISGKRKSTDSAEADMTPMIDMTFQLIAFFMILINFSEENQSERIRLPLSELAQPPEGEVESPILLQVASDGKVIYSGEDVPIEQMRSKLILEKQLLSRKNPPKLPRDANVIIRADADTPTGKIQELIKMCQEQEFERFSLRAKQDSKQ